MEIFEVIPLFDAATHRKASTYTDTEEPEYDRVKRVWALEPIPPEEIAAMLQRQVGEAVQRHLDATAQARGYENIHTCVTYAGEPAVPRFQAEGRAARAWRSAVWAQCYAALDDVLAGRRAPLTPEQMVAELPPLVWPGD